jgi:methylenetetrahydrofolate dehydrogenase (NADP+)/methenyltetrahydrofolate cyclohydrolase
MYTLIDGKKIAAEIRNDLAIRVKSMSENGQRPPHLGAILVGEDGSSQTYVANKIKDCEEVGFKSTLIRLDAAITEQKLLEHIHILNNDPELDGFIVQLPLPRHICEGRIIEAINPAKDVDGFHPENIGKMVAGLDCFLPATPAGIIELIRRYGIPTSRKRCTVIGRSNIVGRPVSILLSQKGIDATVTVVHSRTTDIKSCLIQSDIIIAALGSPGFVTSEMVTEGAAVIDVGTSRIPSVNSKSGYKLAGDVDFENVAHKCSFITPVPGGVGPMTRVSLLQNTMKAALRRI